MVTLLDIKTQAAAILGRSIGDFTVSGQDLWLTAANLVRRTAELNHNFEFLRTLVNVTVNGTTGGSLANAIDDDSNPVDVNTVIDVGILDQGGNLIPATWTTVAEGLERQRQANPYSQPRYPRDGDLFQGTCGGPYFTFSGNQIKRWPKSTETSTIDYPVKLEVYSFYPDWTESDLASTSLTISGTIDPDITGTYPYLGLDSGMNPVYGDTDWQIKNGGGGDYFIYTLAGILGGNFWSKAGGVAGTYTEAGTYMGQPVAAISSGTSDIWTTHATQFLLWATVVHLNQKFRVFVPRQEGNLPPPSDKADAGLQAFVEWDSNRYEQFRRHNR